MKVLLIDIDTLRPDHMGCYGYIRDTTPCLDAIAREGVRYEQYYCSDAPCLPSRASLVSGMFGIRNGAVGHGGTAGDRRLSGRSRGFSDDIDCNNFHNVFRRAGMKTASISTFPERHSSWWFCAGFNETYNVGDRGLESGERILPVALDWLDRNKEESNWFLHIHLWDPHTPYRAPASFGNPFQGEPMVSWINEDVLRLHEKHTGPHSVHELNMFDDGTDPAYPRQLGSISTLSDVRQVMDGYDCGVRYADMLVGQLFDQLKVQGIYDDMAIIVTSDHGENMGEWGIYAEHATADQSTCHIPLLIKWPGGKKGQVDSGLHYSLDLVPTVSDLLGVVCCKNWDGKSFSKTITEGKSQARESLVLSQMAHVCQRSARFADWLYVRTYHDGFHLLDDEMLYNLKRDPYEQNDCKDSYPQVCAQGAKIILDWHDEMMKKSSSTIDPLWTVLQENGPFHTHGKLDAYLTRLEQTGRSAGAQQLRKKYRLNKE